MAVLWARSGHGAVVLALLTLALLIAMAPAGAEPASQELPVISTLSLFNTPVIVTAQKDQQEQLRFTSGTDVEFMNTLTLEVDGGSTKGAVTYRLDGGPCELDGNKVRALAGTGSCQVTATMSGDETYEDVETFAVLALMPAAQKVNWPPLSGSAGQAIGLAELTLESDLVPVIAAGPPEICEKTGDVPALLKLNAPGSCTVAVTQEGDANYAWLEETRTFEVARHAQSISWDQDVMLQAGVSSLSLLATASSGLPVAYLASPKDVCSISGGNILNISDDADQCSVTASQPGDESYSEAAPVVKTFSIGKAAPDPLTFTSATSLAYKETLTLAVSGGPPGAEVSFAHVSGACVLEGTTVTATSGTGNCVIKAAVAKSNSEVEATTTISLRKLSQTTRQSLFKARALDVVPLSSTVVLDSGLPPAVTIAPQSDCAITGANSSELTFLKRGVCTLIVEQEGDENHLSAAGIVSIEVRGAPQSVTWRQDLTPAFGDDPIPLTATASSELPVSYVASTPDVCSIAKGGLLTLNAAGTCGLTALQQGDGIHDSAPDVIKTFTIAKAKQRQLIFASVNRLTYGESLELSMAGGLAGAAVFYELTSGPCTLEDGKLTANAGTGTCSVTALKPGGVNYEDASASFDIILDKRVQIINAPKALSGRVLDEIDLASSVSADSQLPLDFETKTPGLCSVTDSGSVRLLGTGDCLIMASQDGGKNYLYALATVAIVITQAAQSIEWDQSIQAAFGDDDIPLTAAAGQGLTVSYTAGPQAICAIATSNMLKIMGAGECTIIARQDGNDAFQPAEPVSRIVVIAKAEQPPLTNGSASSLTFGQSLDLAVNGGASTAPVSYELVSGPCTLSGHKLTATSGTGDCFVQAKLAGNDNYEDAASDMRITLKRRGQLITWKDEGSGQALQVIDFAAVVSVDSGLPLRLEVLTPGLCEVSGSALQLARQGLCRIAITQDGNSDFAPAEETVSIAIYPMGQSIIWDQTLAAAYGDGDILLKASAAEGLDVSYAAGPGNICAIAGSNMLSILGAGECTITARQDGNEVHAPAEPVERRFTIAKAAGPGVPFSLPPLAAGQEVTLSVDSGQRNGVVTYAVAESSLTVCELVAPGILRGKAPGTCSVTATLRDLAGNYEDVSVTASVGVGKGAQSALVVKASGQLGYPGSVTLTTTGGAGGGAVTYQASGPCTLAGDQLTSMGLGTCRVTAAKDADDLYTAVISEPLDIQVGDGLAATETGDEVGQNLAVTAQTMLDFNPHTSRLDARRGAGGSPVAFMPQGSSANGMVAFAASAGQIVAAAGKGDMQIMPAAAERPGQGYDPYLRMPGSVDVWIDGRFMWRNGADGKGGLDQRIFLGETGVDVLLADNLLLGISVRLDTNDATRGGKGGTLDTLGWLAGPYMVWDIAPGLQADAKLAYGRSSTDISLITDAGRFEGSYGGTRWLAEAGLRGTLDLSPLRIEPGLRASYFRETAEAFTLSGGGGAVRERRLSLLRIAFDPRISYIIRADGGAAISPFLSPQLAAEWHEASAEDEGWDIYGAVEGGIGIATESFVFNASLSASGIGGDGAVSYSLGAELTVPLN